MNYNQKLRLANNQHYPIAQKKSCIVLHHTAGFSAESCIRWWNQTPQNIGVAYVIERDGTIYEAFDSKCWAYHLGTGNLAMEKASIGVELVALGPVEYKGGKYLAYGKEIDPKEIVNIDYRGFKHFQGYTEKQIKSLIVLLDDLSKRFNIPLKYAPDGFTYNREFAKTGKGPYTVFPHTYIRADKSDLFPDPILNLLKMADLPVTELPTVKVVATPTPAATPLPLVTGSTTPPSNSGRREKRKRI